MHEVTCIASIHAHLPCRSVIPVTFYLGTYIIDSVIRPEYQPRASLCELLPILYLPKESFGGMVRTSGRC